MNLLLTIINGKSRFKASLKVFAGILEGEGVRKYFRSQILLVYGD